MPAQRTILVVLISVLLCFEPVFAQSRERDGRTDPSMASKVHPALVQRLQASGDPVKAWVFFTDKGLDSPAAYDSAIRQVEESYDPRARLRRARRGDNAGRGGALFDERDLPVAAAYVDGVSASGAAVHVHSRWLNAVSAWVDRDALEAIAELPYVRAVRAVGRGSRVQDRLHVSPFESEAGPARRAALGGGLDYGLALEQLTQINLVALHEAGATGSGVVIGMLDTGYRQDHVAFNHPDKPLTVIAEFDFLDGDGDTDIEPGDPSAQHVHGTLILGTLASYAPGALIGAAHDASYILCKTEDTTAEYPAEEDNYVAGLEFIEANGGDVVNSSLGYIEWYTQDDLDGQTAVTTIAVNIATANGVVCCTSAGNDGNDDDPTTSRLIAPADAIKVLTVGAVDSTGAISQFSSDGPSADGRVKPEVMARGVSTFTIAAENTTEYNGATGTSISSPLVAGAVACLLELHPEWTVDQIRNVLFNTADDFVANGTHDPLFVRGYGVINTHAAGLDCNLNSVMDACDLDCGAAAGPCDVPGCGLSIDCNTDGIPDDCEPDCNGNDVADGCDLAACAGDDASCQDCNRNGILDECDEPFPQQGRLTLDAGTYVCDASVLLTVDDCGLDTDADLVESVEVVVVSDSDPTAEAITLTENGPGTGRFEGTVALSEVNDPGVLQVADGDTLTASYLDADDGLGGIDVTVIAEADVDCSAPVVSDIVASAIGPFDAVVSFTTAEPALATVRYGSSCLALGLAASSTQFQTAFSIALSDLTATTTYFFAIDVVDLYGNTTTYDADGSCFSFETPEIPNYYTERFDDADGDNDMDFRALLFTPDGSADIYAPCTFGILDLPTDPAGGTPLNLADDDFVEVILPEGMSVSLYGVSYGTFYVGAYGYITFESGDDEFFDTLAHHFDQPRIAVLFDIWHLSEGGSVSWKLLADRVAVTYEDVPELFQDNSSTFQVEMFFDGRIRLSYLNLDADDGLVGLSAGTGVVPGFAETDLSEVGGCGPMPPAATDFDVVTASDTPLQIQLLGVDDGQPDPPGTLAYTILSLPEHGTLDDPGAGSISITPHTLAGNSGLVEYQPDPGYGGLDGFQYMVDDGGVPPEGGGSNSATVTITVGLPTVAFAFDLDVDPGWTAEGQWAYGQPTGGGSHDGDPSAGFSGPNVIGYNLNGDYPDFLPPTHLTTTPLDCSALIQTELRFWRWLGVEYGNFDKAAVSVSNDGSDWVVVWNNDGTTISDAEWIEQIFDISAIADGQPTVFVRWTMGPTDDIVTYPGWNIDDVEISGVQVSAAGCADGSIAACADGDGDGIRDDGCVFWECVSGQCVGTDITHADLGGPNGSCFVDGAADGNDRFHALNCFSDQDTTGLPGYPCEAAPPAAYNVDAAGLGTPCTPDGVCDGNDAFAALNAFSNNTTCTCAGAPAPEGDSQFGSGQLEETKLALVPSVTRVAPGAIFEIDVVLQAPLADLRGYQLHAAITGPHPDEPVLVDMYIRRGPGAVPARANRSLRDSTTGHVFANRPYWEAYNLDTRQMLVGLDGPGVRTSRSGAYLATLVYRTGKGTGHFVVDLLHDSRDPAQRTYLFATAAGRHIGITATTPATVEVAIEP